MNNKHLIVGETRDSLLIDDSQSSKIINYGGAKVELHRDTTQLMKEIDFFGTDLLIIGEVRRDGDMYDFEDATVEFAEGFKERIDSDVYLDEFILEELVDLANFIKNSHTTPKNLILYLDDLYDQSDIEKDISGFLTTMYPDMSKKFIQNEVKKVLFEMERMVNELVIRFNKISSYTLFLVFEDDSDTLKLAIPKSEWK